MAKKIDQKAIIQELDRIAKLLVRRDLALTEEREKREKDLRELERTAKILVRRDLALSEANERLIVMDKAKSEFLAIAAHQLRTPLSGVKWTLRMMIDGDMGKIAAEQKKFLEKGYETNERMIHLVNDLLDVVRIEEGRFIYQRQEFQLADLIKEIIEGFKEIIKEKNLNLEFSKPKEKIPKLTADLEKIRLVLQNLLDNAIRYTPIEGRVKVSISMEDNGLKASIEDNGLGIPKQQQARVFTKFFRGSNVIRRETEGTGLGLYITKNIIEAHGGQIGFTSEENKGSTFWFTLPLNPQ